MPKKSIQELRVEGVKIARNRCLSRWSFQPNARTFGDMLNNAGYKRGDIEYIYNGCYSKPITTKEINDYFNNEHLRVTLENQHVKVEANEHELEAYKEYFQIVQAAVEETKKDGDDESIFIVDNSIDTKPTEYYDPRPSNQLAILHPKQILAAREIVNGFLNGITAFQLRAAAGHGKTYAIGSVLRNLFNMDWFKDSNAVYPMVYVTKSAQLVEQADRVLVNEFGLDPIKQIKIINIEQLRSLFGTMFVEKQVDVEDGKEYIRWRWRNYMFPKLIIWDENHNLKNEGSTQSCIAQAYNDIPEQYGTPVYQIFSSATPYMRVADAKCLTVACGITFDYGIQQNVKVDNSNWKDFSEQIAHPADPLDYSPAAVDRLTNILSKHIVRMKNVRPKYHSRDYVEEISFRNEAQREQYNRYWEKFKAEKARIQGIHALSESQSNMMMFARFNKLCEGAELIRAEELAERAVRAWEEGRSLGCAVKHKGTITAIVKCLLNTYGWKRDDISLIWGGSAVTINKKKQLAQRINSNEDVRKLLNDVGIDLAAFGLDFSDEELVQKTDEEIEWEKEQRLLHQTPEERIREIDRYQHQKTKACFFTYKSGGAGLSLHHQYKHARPRVGAHAPVFSAFDLIQVLGRLPRLTSLSDTEQALLYYTDTFEVIVADKVRRRLACHGRVVRQREDWIGMAVGLSVEEEEDEENMEGTYIENEDEDTED